MLKLSNLARGIVFVFVLALALWISPAEACGCGAYIPRDGDAFISQEQALLRWDGHTEQILMTLGILGSSKEAAVILPVPARATVKLGSAQVWSELKELTKPQVKHEKRYIFPMMLGAGGAAPTGAAPVTLLERQTLGPFEVSNLAATDAKALVDWLQSNGYALSPTLAGALQPYITQGWFYVAVRLQPGAGDTLQGTLDPLWVTFASDQIVYPMRASKNAHTQQTVTVYVLADHRVSKTQNFGRTHISFADWIEPAALTQAPSLAAFVDRKLFLTKFQETVEPAQVNDDFVFKYASADEPAHDTVTVYDDDPLLAYAILLCLGLLLLSPFVLLLALAVFILRRWRPARTSV